MFRWIHAAVPAVLLHACIGSVYCWSQYSANLMEIFGTSKLTVDIGFTLIIFFLGMSAACFGSIIEKNPKIGAILSTIIFSLGMVIMALAIRTTCLPMMFVATSLIGCGTGIGYVTPIKTMMLYFADHKGLASGLAITGFGLAKFLVSPFIEFLLKSVSLEAMFLILSGIYLTIMCLSTVLLRKYPNYDTSKSDSFSDIWNIVLKKKEYASIWLMFCINISCGLAFIANEKGILQSIGVKEIGIILSLCALFNALGRLGFSALSDKIGRKAVYHFICTGGIFGCFFAFTGNIILAVVGILAIEAVYGGNFSSIPALLAKRFGIQNVSRIHSITLTGWSIGGIIGPLLANLIHGNSLYLVLACLYLIGFSLMYLNIRKS